MREKIICIFKLILQYLKTTTIYINCIFPLLVCISIEAVSRKKMVLATENIPFTLAIFNY
jgi:hypothetical protein